MHTANKTIVEYDSLTHIPNKGEWLVYTKDGSRLVFLDRDIIWYCDSTEEFETLTSVYVPA